MLFGEIAFLTLVLAAFLTFICVVGFISIWSGRPSQMKARDEIIPMSLSSQPTTKRSEMGPAIVSLIEAHPPRAA